MRGVAILAVAGRDDVVAQKYPVGKSGEHSPGTLNDCLRPIGNTVKAAHFAVRCVVLMAEIDAAVDVAAFIRRMILFIRPPPGREWLKRRGNRGTTMVRINSSSQ